MTWITPHKSQRGKYQRGKLRWHLKARIFFKSWTYSKRKCRKIWLQSPLSRAKQSRKAIFFITLLIKSQLNLLMSLMSLWRKSISSGKTSSGSIPFICRHLILNSRQSMSTILPLTVLIKLLKIWSNSQKNLQPTLTPSSVTSAVTHFQYRVLNWNDALCSQQSSSLVQCRPWRFCRPPHGLRVNRSYWEGNENNKIAWKGALKAIYLHNSLWASL